MERNARTPAVTWEGNTPRVPGYKQVQATMEARASKSVLIWLVTICIRK
ncbi:MAG: hypothetical protein K9L23_11655 [Desulfotignum sp.]|nr:hypothetical protein [Desulfotignum sp.]MCF8088701.1 hypothetical protein [Desulfotignum sp.]